MISNTFLFLEGINKKLEQNIWKQGIFNWNSFLNKNKIKGVSKKRKSYYDRKLIQAQKALYNFDSNYFTNKLPLSECWRLYDFFKEDTVFLDIETTGLRSYDDITVVGLFDGIETKMMIKNINLDYNEIKKELSKYKLIVTFNGSSFDLPFIERRYPNILPKIPHFDLKSVTNRLNLKGGLKQIETKLKIKRNKIIENFYGGDALRLWKMYKVTGDKYYLNLLVEYNEEDIVNLKPIANFMVEKLKQDTINKYLNNS